MIFIRKASVGEKLLLVLTDAVSIRSTAKQETAVTNLDIANTTENVNEGPRANWKGAGASDYFDMRLARFSRASTASSSHRSLSGSAACPRVQFQDTS
jgi:hypothetical protein